MIQFYLGKLYYRLEMVDEAYDVLSTSTARRISWSTTKDHGEPVSTQAAHGRSRRRTQESPGFQETSGRTLPVHPMPSRIGRVVGSLPALRALEHLCRSPLADAKVRYRPGRPETHGSLPSPIKALHLHLKPCRVSPPFFLSQTGLLPTETRSGWRGRPIFSRSTVHD